MTSLLSDLEVPFALRTILVEWRRQLRPPPGNPACPSRRERTCCTRQGRRPWRGDGPSLHLIARVSTRSRALGDQGTAKENLKWLHCRRIDAVQATEKRRDVDQFLASTGRWAKRVREASWQAGMGNRRRVQGSVGIGPFRTAAPGRRRPGQAACDPGEFKGCLTRR